MVRQETRKTMFFPGFSFPNEVSEWFAAESETSLARFTGRSLLRSRYHLFFKTIFTGYF